MAGTMSGGGRRGGGGISGINVTPLVDVVLVLLIILMVSSTYIVAQTLKVKLPKTKASDGTTDKPKIVVLTAKGELLLDDKAISEEALVKDLKAILAANEETNVVVSADAKVEHGRVVHVIDLAKQAGVVHFAINVQQE